MYVVLNDEASSAQDLDAVMEIMSQDELYDLLALNENGDPDPDFISQCFEPQSSHLAKSSRILKDFLKGPLRTLRNLKVSLKYTLRFDRILKGILKILKNFAGWLD